ncbi:MAG: response regulator, partial [Nitrospirae bacterium]|nr:response regulator [Nitrospirota bacterium]
ATQIHQAVRNLCTVAWHALGGQPGSIMMDLAPVTLTQTKSGLYTILPPGHYARLSVRDTGCGMGFDGKMRRANPFFANKPLGQDMGLGVGLVRGILRGHESSLVVESEPGLGTTVHLYFPAAKAPLGTSSLPPQGRRCHVLYLDDEAMVVELVRARLEWLGYQVTGCTGMTEALDALRAGPAGFDVMVTDYNMPEQSGLEVARALSQIRTNLPVVLASEYLSPTHQAIALAAGISEIVYKPALLQHLGSVVARLSDLSLHA